MKKKNKQYDNESISSLKGADRVRLRPSVIFGSDSIEGCKHSMFEILSNAIDEAREGFGDTIEVSRFMDGSISIKDYGRGIPLDFNKNENRYNWELIFCELYAGGKYHNNQSSHYEYSLGLNGLGACATQYASEYMIVEVVRDGYLYELYFEKGENIGGLKKKKTKEHSHTYIQYRPDIEVFTDIIIPCEYFEDILKKQAVVNGGLTFVFYDEESDQTKTFQYPNGIKDYVIECNENKEITPIQYFEHEAQGKDREDREEYKFKMELCFNFNNEINRMEYYHNSSYLEYGGSPDKAIRQSFVSAIDKYLKTINAYKKDEKKITFVDIEDSLVLVLSSFSTITSYENQTKKAINNKFIQDTISDFCKTQLEIYFTENKLEATLIAEQILANKRSRETAEKTRVALKKKLTGAIDISNRVEKFVNCRTKDVNRRELYIVEGDSALGACKMGRDAEFQAIIPVRGKILNCLKADYDKIFANQIIMDLIKILGCGIEIKTKHNKDFNSFDLSALKWAKIIICTDADVDGYQIRTLILTMLYRLVPSLITHEKVYIAESPLYEIENQKRSYFAYTDHEKLQIVKKLKGKYSIQRSKGLGENQPEMMWETTMNPETRRLILVQPEDVVKTKTVFELLLGDNLKGRKEFIEDFGHMYLPFADIR